MWTHFWPRSRTRAHRTTSDPSSKRRRRRLDLEPLEDRCLLSGDVFFRWNEIAMQALNNAPPSQVPASRNLALIQAAVFDAVNAIDRSYTPYYADVHASHGASLEAAAAQAAHDTLTALYPAQQATFDAALASDLANIPPGLARQGVAVGQQVAQQILAFRANDGSDAMVTYAPTPAPGVWQPTPPNNAPAANAHVPLIPPFVLPDSSYFRAPPPPALTDTLYTEDYNYTKLVGASDAEANGNRTHDQTNQALDWRLPLVNLQTWNRITQEVAAAQGTTVPQSARLFALLDMAINDGLETSFNNKFYYGLWRPVTAIIHGGLGGANDTDGDPLADGNPDTAGDAHWLPLHPTTPAYPTYTGNAATIGAASATVLSSFFGTNDITFQVHWAYSGETRTYPGFWTAAQEEADSRIFGGIHFRFDTVGGQWVGSHVADYVFNHVLLPVSPGDENDDAMGAAALAAAAPNAAPDLAFLAGALTASPASSLAAGASSIPAPKENQPTIPMAAKAQPSSTSQPLDQPTHSVARSTELDALFADLGGYALADGL